MQYEGAEYNLKIDLKHFSFLGKKKQEYEYACASIKKRTRKE
jgi:hypothetical protein